jgi:O-antigen/teichoic acid export membrane protein
MKTQLAHALRMLRGNASFLANSSLLALGSLVAAGMGFVYWWFAAREFPPAAVGAQSVLISAMALVGMLGDAGFSTLLLGESAGRGRNGHSLIAAATLAGAGLTLLLAVLAAVGLRYQHMMTGADSLLFVIGCALTGFAFVLDCGLIGLGQNRLQLARSLLFSVLKLILLIAVGLFTEASSAILLAWVASLGLTLAVSCGYAWANGVLRLVKPDLRGLMKESSVVINHHLLNLSAAAPPLILPLVVASCLGPAVNAAFYVGFMVRGLIMLITGSLTVVLFSLDTSAPEVLREKLRFSLLVSLAISVAGFLGFVLFGDLLLRVFNPSYPALAGAAMPMFGISLVGGALRLHYVLLARVERKMMAGAAWMSLGGTIELTLAALGGIFGDVRWLALGWVFGLSLTTSFMIRPLFAYTRPSRTVSPVGPAAVQRALAAEAFGRRNGRGWERR